MFGYVGNEGYVKSLQCPSPFFSNVIGELITKIKQFVSTFFGENTYTHEISNPKNIEQKNPRIRASNTEANESWNTKNTKLEKYAAEFCPQAEHLFAIYRKTNRIDSIKTMYKKLSKAKVREIEEPTDETLRNQFRDQVKEHLHSEAIAFIWNHPRANELFGALTAIEEKNDKFTNVGRFLSGIALVDQSQINSIIIDELKSFYKEQPQLRNSNILFT